MEGKHTSYKTDSELALNAVKESLTTRKTVDQSTSFSLVNTDSSVPASDTEVLEICLVSVLLCVHFPYIPTPKLQNFGHILCLCLATRYRPM